MPEGVVGSAEVVILPDTRQFAAVLNQKLGPAFAGVETSVVSVTKAIGGGTKALEVANKAASGIGSSLEVVGKTAVKTVGSTELLTKELGSAAKATYGVDAGLVRVSAEAQRASDATAKMSDNFKQAGQSAHTLGTLSAVAGTAVAAAFVGAATSLGRVGLEYNTLLQKTRAAFTTLLGTKEAAQDMITQLTEFARSSPFPRQAFIAGAQQLIGFGIEAQKVIPIFQAVQDAVAAVGGGEQDIAQFTNIFAAIQADGQASLMQLQRFSSQGIDAVKLLAAQAGISYDEMVKKIRSGNLDAATSIDLLTKALESKFAGAAAGVKETWIGAVDRVKGAWRDMGSALLAPFIDPEGGGAAVKWANNLADVLRRIQKQYVEPFAAKLKEMLGAFTNAHPFDIDKIFAKIEPALDMIKEFAPLLGALGGGLTAILAPMLPIIGEFLPHINPIFSAIVGLIATTPELREAILPLLKTFGDIVKTIGTALTPLLNSLAKAFVPIIEKVLKLASTFIEKLIPIVDKLFVALTPIIDALGVAFMEILKELEPLMDPLVNAIAQVVDAFILLLPSLLPLIPPLGKLLGLLLKFSLKMITEGLFAFAALVVWASPAIEKFFDIIGIGLASFADLLGGKETQNTKEFSRGIDEITGSFKNLGDTDPGGFLHNFINGIKEVGDHLGGLWDNIENIAGEIPGYFGGLWDNIEDTAGKLGEPLGDIWDDVEDFTGKIPEKLGGVWDSVEKAAGEIPGYFGGAWENIEDAVGKIPGLFGKAISDTIKNFVGMPFAIAEGLKNAGVWIWDHALKPAWEYIRDHVPTALGEIVDQFEELPGRIRDGIWNMGSSIWEAFQAAKDWISENIPGFLGGIVDQIEELPGRLKDAVWGLGGAIWEAFTAAGKWIGDNIPGFLGGIVDRIEGLPGMLWDALLSGLAGIGKIGQTVGNFFIDFINDNIIKAINEGIPNDFFGFDIEDNPIGKIQRLHSGGFIPGAGEVPAVLLGGEAVLNRGAAAKLGPEGVAALNAGGSSSTTNQNITVVGVSWEQAMAKIRLQQQATVRGVLVS